MFKSLSVVVAGLIVAASVSNATVIDFEDAYGDLGYRGAPTSYYQSSGGVRFEGIYFGLIGGNGNGDPGNFNLEGTNGSASLAVNTITHEIDMVFDATFSSLVLDLGVANGLTSQITIKTYNDNVLIDSAVLNFTDTLFNGDGTWFEQTWSNRDRVTLTASGGWRAWSIDNVRINEGVPPPVPLPAGGLLLLGSLGGLAVFKARKKRVA